MEISSPVKFYNCFSGRETEFRTKVAIVLQKQFLSVVAKHSISDFSIAS